MKVSQPVFLNADRTIAVPEGHKNAAFLLVGRNGTLADDVAQRYGITVDGVSGVDENAGERKLQTGIAPHLFNESAPDGVNTAAGTPAATGTAPVIVAGTDVTATGETQSAPGNASPETTEAAAKTKAKAGKGNR